MERRGDAGAMPGEFSLIEQLFEPLAGPEGLSLQDDAAILSPRAGYDLVLTKDAIAEGRHYLLGDPAETIAKKLLRVNLSDLTAKGATPRGYLLSCAWSQETSFDWMRAFAEGLKEDQAAFDIALWGGDTIRLDGPSVFTLTALGEVPIGQMIQRGGAAPGDDLWVTGTLGDAALGLLIATGEFAGGTQADRDHLIGRYHIPEPPVTFGPHLRQVATAALDVSDGLLGDLEHLCRASKVGAEIVLEAVPLSRPMRACVGSVEAAFDYALTGGDDYQILFSASASVRRDIERYAAEAGAVVCRIGSVTNCVNEIEVVGPDGNPRPFARHGFRHF
ncbi:MAG: thiamine-phosphate kinase [Rhodobiaceae bacterium]|nr:thiamine-phosphate kinase [Rhodobiaceae bacterium]